MFAPKIHESPLVNNVALATWVQVSVHSASASGVGSIALQPVALGEIDRVADPFDLGLDARRQVRERAVGAQHHEPVGEVRRGDAQVAGRLAVPVVVDVQAVAAADLDAPVVAVHGVEPGGEDQDVQLVQDAVLGHHTVGGDLADGVLLDGDGLDVRAG